MTLISNKAQKFPSSVAQQIQQRKILAAQKASKTESVVLSSAIAKPTPKILAYMKEDRVRAKKIRAYKKFERKIAIKKS